jgi:hypothetical protein
MRKMMICLAGLMVFSMAAGANTFVVDATSSEVDANPGDGMCRTAGGLCTFRAAVMESNALAGDDLIHFNIAPGGIARIQLAHTVGGVTSSLGITDTVTIDGSTQPGLGGQPRIEITCFNAFNGLLVNAPNVQIRDVAFTGFPIAGIQVLADQALLQRVWFGKRLDTQAVLSNGRDVIIGADETRVERARFAGNGAGIEMLPLGNSSYVVDSFFDVFVDPGALCSPVANPLVHVRGSGHEIGPGNVFAPGNAPAVLAEGTSSSLVSGNLFGHDASGAALCTGTGGAIFVVDGVLDISANTIGGLGNDAVSLLRADGSYIHGNRIGVNALDGAAPIDGSGVRVEDSDDVVIGRRRDGSEDGNIVGHALESATICNQGVIVLTSNALGTDFGGLTDLGNAGPALDINDCQVVSSFNHFANSMIGVRVLGDSARFDSSGDVFSGNDGLPVDLNGDGPTANDPGDVDIGPNGLLNTIEAAMVADTYIEFDAGSTLAAGTYVAEFYGAESCARDIGGVSYGDGRYVGGELPFTVDGSGAPSLLRWGVAIRFAYWLIRIRHIASGASSEFSRCFRQSGGYLGDRVWRDYNQNGLQDQREPGIPGITVTLMDGAGNALDSRITGADGRYRFADLPTGSYRLGFGLAAAHKFTLLDAGPDDIDSDVIIAQGRTAPFLYTFGTVDVSRDCGQIPELFLHDFGELRSGP